MGHKHRPIPPDIAFEIGEFLYHMRAVLDGCVYEAACLKSGQRPPPNESNLEFIFRDRPETFHSARRKLDPLAQEQRDVVESAQPYKAPTLPNHERPYSYHRGLSILNDWARKDRHRKLHVIASWASNINPLLIIPEGTTLVDFSVPRDTFILKDESQVATSRITGWQRGMKINGVLGGICG